MLEIFGIERILNFYISMMRKSSIYQKKTREKHYKLNFIELGPQNEFVVL